jgi:hypothetical protein
MNKESKNIFLPQITLYYDHRYRVNPRSRAKRPRKVYWYTDHFIEPSFLNMPVPELVAIMNERERFAGLREFVQKVLKTKGTAYRTRFIIDAQTMQDCFLAIVYMNHYLCLYFHDEFDYYRENLYFYHDHTPTYQYHVDWRDYSPLDSLKLGAGSNVPEEDGGARVKTAEKEDEDDGSVTEEDMSNRPLWSNGGYPMYIDINSPKCERALSDLNVSKKDVSTLTIADIERAIKFSLAREKAFCDDRVYRIGFGE